uniref:SH3 domain-containing protein n=1 Tax=Angiostrongylus cantonensis TaxID=6313 RepID=A0A0K0DDY7_ANGCA
MVGNVKSLVNRLSKDFSASKPPLSVQESRKTSQPLQHVITTFAYSAAQDDELSLELGDIIEVLEEVEDGWSRGRQLRTNIIGMFPTNFVKPSGSILEMARVKFEYEPQHSDELRLGEIGQLITIIRKDCGDAGWFEGEINGRRGLFPDNFVELVQVPINTQSGMIYHPPPPQHVKVVAKPPMVNPVGMVPPAVPAKPLKQKLSDSSMSINGSSVLTPSTTTVTNPSHVMPCNVKHQSSAFAAARDRISKVRICVQPIFLLSIVPSRPMSSVEMETVEDMTSPLSHVTKTRARPPGKRPATLLLNKKKEAC